MYRYWMLLAVLIAMPCGLAAQDKKEGEPVVTEKKEEAPKELPKAEKKEEQATLWTKLGSMFKPYGFVQLDAAWSDSRFGLDAELAAFVRSEDPAAPRTGTNPVGAPKNESEFTMYTRLARLGFDLDFGKVEELGDVHIGGKVEVDFYALPASDSRNLLRMRHAYLTMKWTNLEILAGQTSDLISPRFPAINYDMVMWGAGNLGDRRPQARATANVKFDKATLTFAVMFGMTGAVDAQNLDSNNVLDGAQSALPTVQARIGFDYKLWEKGNQMGFGIWSHWAKEEVDNFNFGARDESHFDSWALGLDMYFPIYEDRVWIQGEAWIGEDLDDVRGGIFQGVNADGEEIRSIGGWLEVGFKIFKWWNAHVGFASDDPDSVDLPATGKVSTQIGYLKFDWAFGPVYFAFEFSHWETEYKGFGAGRANRFKGYVGYKF